MAVLNSQTISISGLVPTYQAAAVGGDQVRPGDRTFLHVKNTDGSPATVTIAVPGKEYGVDRADVPIVVPATTGDCMIGPFPRDLVDPITGNVLVTYSAVTGLTVAALNL